METALCLMECGQPVYPLDIVRTMRDQRAMMIQTPSQYRFVCEAILKVYEEGLFKPQAVAIYQLKEKPREEKAEDETKKEAKKEDGGEPEKVEEEAEAAVVELLEGALDEEDEDDDEEVEVLDVGEVTEEEEEEPSVASCTSVTSVTSETSANPDPDPVPADP